MPSASSDPASSTAPMVRVLGVCGSLQRASSNLEALHALADAPPAGIVLDMFDGVRALPHFDPDMEEQGTPVAVSAWRRAIARSEAVLITCPEYGHSLPGALKNAIDWVIGSGELYQKIVGVTAIVRMPGRGRQGLAALCQTLAAVDARVVGGEPIVRCPTYLEDLTSLLQTMAASAEHGRVAAR